MNHNIERAKRQISFIEISGTYSTLSHCLSILPTRTSSRDEISMNTDLSMRDQQEDEVLSKLSTICQRQEERMGYRHNYISCVDKLLITSHSRVSLVLNRFFLLMHCLFKVIFETAASCILLSVSRSGSCQKVVLA